jgi:hypothetical protein
MKPRDINCSFRMELKNCPTCTNCLTAYNILPSNGPIILALQWSNHSVMQKKNTIVHLILVRFKILFLTNRVVYLIAMNFRF